MSESFPNAPLVELVAEVRWIHPNHSLPGAEPLDAFAPVDPDEANRQLYEKVAAGLAMYGYLRAERLLPPGFAASAHTPVYRYAGVAEDESRIAFMVGPGVFSINAIPPYRTWDHFKPEVIKGLEVLLSALSDDIEAVELNRVVLRYIDAFQGDFLKRGSRYDFLSQSLGFTVTLPDSVLALMDRHKQPNVFLQMGVPIGDNTELAIRCGEASVRNEEAVVLDMAVARSAPMTPKLEEIVGILDAAHTVINKIFVQMTKPVERILRGSNS